MAIEISCPNCGEEFRVKDEAAGKTFKCKSCGETIRVPEADDDDNEDDLPPRRRARDDHEDDDDRPRRRRKGSAASGKTLGPAIGLYVTGGLWLVYCIVSGVFTLTNPNAMAGKPPPGADPAREMGYYIGFYGVLIAFPLITLFVLFGAFCLHTRRLYPMALIACIVASIPICSPGCCLGIPFGIWGIVVLMNEDVKQSFS